jgi:ketopantoate hydroxymethyltransferase
VLVMHDLLGIEERYGNLAQTMRDGFAAFAQDVRERTYPQPEHGYKLKSSVLADLRGTEESA